MSLRVERSLDDIGVSIEATPVIRQEKPSNELILGKIGENGDEWMVRDRILDDAAAHDILSNVSAHTHGFESQAARLPLMESQRFRNSTTALRSHGSCF